EGRGLAFPAEPVKDMAWSTNTDIWTVPVEGGQAKNLTGDNTGADAQPAYSPDGRLLAYISQARAGFEADQWVLKVRDRSSGKTSELTKALDRPVQSFSWEGASNGSSRVLVAGSGHKGTEPRIPVRCWGAGGGGPRFGAPA